MTLGGTDDGRRERPIPDGGETPGDGDGSGNGDDAGDGPGDAPPDHVAWRDAQSTLPVSVDGHDVDVAYWESGSGNGGPPVVLLHGIPTWSYLWRRVAPPLSGDVHVVAPDLAGYGFSSNRDGFDRSVRAQEAVVDGLLDDLDAGPAVLVGHDIGGGVALRYAWHHPDRVAGLVLSNAVCYDSWPVQFVADLGLPETGDRPTEEVVGELEAAVAAGVYADETDPAFVAGMVAPWERDGGPRALARAAVATNTNHTTEIDYGGIDAPALCLWGGEDVMQPVAYGERLADDLGCEVVALDRAYHWVVEDRPEAYREHLRSFLSERVSAGG